MKTNIIVAIDRAGAIGNAGDQLYYIREDLRHFKELTLGHPVIMGRKTFEALPRGPLPGRRNIVITRNSDFRPEGAEIAPSLEKAIAMCAAEGEAFIIGGAQIYALALPLATDLYITEIDDTAPAADTFFPPIPADFRLLCASAPLPTTPSIRFLHYTKSK